MPGCALQDLGDDDGPAAVVTLCALRLLVRNDAPDGEPDPDAVDEMLTVGAVTALLRITLLSDMAAVAVVALLHLIVRQPRVEAGVAAADCARPLVTALGAAFKSSLDDVRIKGAVDVRAQIVTVIGRLIEGRPDLAQALLTAGILGEVVHFLAPTRDVEERKLAMELTEKLLHQALGACEAMKAEGVFTHLHQLTLGGPSALGDQSLGMDAGALPPEAADAILEGEALQATAVLCMAAGSCGGVLEVANGNGEPTSYTPGGVVPPTPAASEAIPSPNPSTPEASPAPGPKTPEAAPAPSCGTPEAGPIPSPRSPEARPTAIPETPEAAPADAAGNEKVLHSGPGAPEDAAAQALAHAKVRRPSRRVCSMCGAVSQQKHQVCTRCRKAAYCGRECQAAHWPVHKSECRGVA